MYEINTFLTLLIVKYVCYLVRSETNGMISNDTLNSQILMFTKYISTSTATPTRAKGAHHWFRYTWPSSIGLSLVEM